MFENIDLKKELIKERALPLVPERQLMDEVNELFHTSHESDVNISARLKKSLSKNILIETITVSENDNTNVFTLEQIKTICVKYRLRFLDTKLFNGDYPYEAIIKIREFEKRNDCEVKEFKLMAPAQLFKLIDPDKDPLLFANIGNGNYYLIHQWGNDLAWYRKFLAWPFRNLKNIVLTLLTLSLLVTFFLPSSLIVHESKLIGQIYLGKMIFFLLFTLGTFAFTLRFSLRGNKNLNDLDWDNRYIY